MATSRRGWIRGLLLITAIAAGLLLSACSTAAAQAPKPLSAEAVPAELSQSANGSASQGAAGSKATQSSSGGSVTINVTLDDPKDATTLKFEVAMDTHSVELDGYDLAKLAILRNGQGQEVKPVKWDASSGGHHRSGTLAFSAKDGSGKPIVGAGVKSLDLVIRDVAGVKERVLKWEVPQ
jgi:hypothetical protein